MSERFEAPKYGRNPDWVDRIASEGLVLLDRDPLKALTVHQIAKRLKLKDPVQVHDHVIREARMNDDEASAAVCFTVARLRKLGFNFPEDRDGRERLHFLTDNPFLLRDWENRRTAVDELRLQVFHDQTLRRVNQTSADTSEGRAARLRLRYLTRYFEDREALRDQEAALEAVTDDRQAA